MSQDRAWMPLYVADYLADSGHLTTTEHGAYLLLIMHYWRMGSLPIHDGQLARIAKCSIKEWKKLAPTLQSYFHSGWCHKRIDAEIENARLKYESRRKAGVIGNNAKAMRKQCVRNEPALGTQLQSQSQSYSSVAKATGEPRSPLPEVLSFNPARQELFDLVNPTAKQFLLSEKQIRGIFGRAVKLAGGDHSAIVDLVRAAQREPPLRFEAWLLAACKPVTKVYYGLEPEDGDDEGNPGDGPTANAEALGSLERRHA